MATKKNFKIQQGSIFLKLFTFKHKVTELPYDLSGYAARGKIKEDYDSNTIIDITLEVQDPPTDGKLLAKILPEDTASIEAGSYIYDIELYHLIDTDYVIRVVEGKVTVSPEVTK